MPIMRLQDQLLHYIKSLNANERRYFKLYNKLNTAHKSYDLLFDELLAANSYDGEVLARKLKKSESQLSSEKEYLEKVLFRTMRVFHEGSSIRIELGNRIQEIEMLYNKQLYPAAMRKIEKALKVAIDNELFEQAIIIIRWHHITFQFLGKQVISTKVIAIEKKIMEQLANEMEYRHLFYRFSFMVNEVEHYPGAKAEEKCRPMLENPLLQDENKALSIKAKISYFRMWGDYHTRVTYNAKQTTFYYQKIVKLLEKNPVILHSQLRMYLYILQGLVSSYSSTGLLKDAEAVVQKTERLLTDPKIKLTPALRQEIHEMLIFDKMALLAYGDKHKDLVNYVESFDYKKAIEPFMPSHNYIFRFWVARAYLMVGKPGKALEISMQLLDNHPDDAISFMQANYHLYLLIQYDLGNYTIMDSVLKSYGRWCKKHKLTDVIYKDFANMLRELVKAKGKEEMKAVSAKYIKLFEPVISNSPNETLFSNLDIENWLKGKTK
jgi:tetratricopeptide (TPR) repeat protein